ncbi:hypothetical protein HRbin28_00151 [bacterium HR28]|nr:hypothetical protein HRbin28_00151 [bacterium HR28]
MRAVPLSRSVRERGPGMRAVTAGEGVRVVPRARVVRAVPVGEGIRVVPQARAVRTVPGSGGEGDPEL